MSNFKYILENDKAWLSIGNGRIKIRWNKRWIPEAADVTVLPTSISLDESSYTLKVEGSYTLTATISPDNTSNKNVIWSSSNEEVATVSNVGEVLAIAEGNCIITAKCEANESLKAECAITVEAKEEEPDSEPKEEA